MKRSETSTEEQQRAIFHVPGLAPADLEVLQSIATARTAQQCNDVLWSATKRFETDKFACGEIDLANRHRAVFYSMQWSESWRRFYLANFLHRDPMLRLLESTDEPFTWREWKRSKKITAEEKAAFDLVGSHGWIDGFVLPVVRSNSHVALVSLVCKRFIDTNEKLYLTHACYCYLERIRSVITPQEFPVAPMGLAPRELECLGLAARGLGDRDIGRELGISVSTAHEHVQRAMKRIGVSTRTEAVALAIAFGAIRI